MKLFNVIFVAIAMKAIIAAALSGMGAVWAVYLGEPRTPDWVRLLMAVALCDAILLGAMATLRSVLTKKRD